MPIKVLLVDDERPARRKMMRLLESATDFEVIGEAADGAQALAAVERLRPDVMFLDVQMPKLDGFQVASALSPPLPEIIFVTAHDEFALKAFEVHALDYLLKPYDQERFEKVLDRIRQRLIAVGPNILSDDALRGRLQSLLGEMQTRPRYADRVMVTENERAFFVAIAAVDWLEGARNYVVLHTSGKTHTLRGTLDGLAQKLDPSAFVRVNRSAIVRLDSIRELQPWFHGEYKILMKDGATLNWSRRYVTAGLPDRILR